LASRQCAQDCGPAAPCEIQGGSYHLRLPDGPGPHPVLIWYHGHRGNGASIHRGGGLQRDFLENGYALLAPNGFQSSAGVRSYPARTGAPRDDVAFTFAALEAAATRGNLAQVPFEGRQIRDWHQGSLWEALARARDRNGCRTNPDAIDISDGFRTRLWDASCSGAPVRLDIHDGGHGLPQGWTARARAFLESSN